MTTKFILTPEQILTDESLSAQEIRFFLYLLTFIKENKHTFIISRFAKKRKISSRQLQEYLDLFSYKGYFTFETVDNKTTVELCSSVTFEKDSTGAFIIYSPCPYDYILLLRSSNSISPSPIGISYVFKCFTR